MNSGSTQPSRHTVRLFGGASIELDGHPLTGAATQRHRLALLALLAVARPAGVTRDKLVAYLWPESSAERARSLLKQAVHAVRQALGDGALLSLGDEVRLDPDVVAVDVIDFEAALQAGDHERAVRWYAGPFLDGFFLPGSVEFDRWADGERDRLARAYGRVLETLATDAEAGGNALGAVEWWHRLAALDRCNGRVAVRLMAALDAAGDRAGALRHAQLHTALLREELGAGPDPDVTAFAEQLRLAPEPRRGAATGVASMEVTRAAPRDERVETASARSVEEPRVPSPVPHRWRVGRALVAVGALATTAALAAVVLRSGFVDRAVPRAATAMPAASIVVLPFANMSADPADEYFSDGMTEELILALGRIGGLRVVARTSAFQFKEKAADVREVGARLGVGSVVEGSVRKSGSRLRITAQLVSTRDGSQLWSESYDRDLADVFAVQEEIARSIANSLRMELAAGAPVVARQTSDPEAYELYLKGRHAWNQRTRASMLQAIEYFEQAIARDSSYALAYSGLAASHVTLHEYIGGPVAEIAAKTRPAAERALALDSTLAEPYGALGLMHVNGWQWREAERAFARALELDPGFPLTYQWYSNYLDAMGRTREALEATRRGLALDPLSASLAYNVVGSYIPLGEFDAAIAEARRMIELHPTIAISHEALGWSLLDAGRPADAIPHLERAMSLGGRWWPLANLGRAYALAGRRDDARRVLDRLMREWGDRPPGGMSIAAVYLALGKRDSAFVWLERDFQGRGGKLPFIHVFAAWAPLRGDPRFTRLLKGMGLELADDAATGPAK